MSVFIGLQILIVQIVYCKSHEAKQITRDGELQVT